MYFMIVSVWTKNGALIVNFLKFEFVFIKKTDFIEY